MKLYNTLTRQIDEIEPLNPAEVTVYTCGPTVYDYAHVGHWFNYVRMDILIRALQSNSYKTKWVMNITDVGHLVSDADDGEDKLEKGAKREGKTAWQVAEFYTKDFLEGMHLLNMLEPNQVVKATDHIAEQIELIQTLEFKAYTYVIDDGVYYDTNKFEGYAAFARLDLGDQQASGRVAVNPQKRNQSDFALWKFSPIDSKRDMEWDSPWGKGFPGWHIECSAMSMKYLGPTLDIHTGGIDHVPVHHTNEIAQSEAATGKRFANHWMHGNHVMVEGEKISKSLSNGIRIQEVTKKGISLEAFRLHVLESHYRSQSQFSWDSLIAAKNRLDGLQQMADLRWQPVQNKGTKLDFETEFEKMNELIANDLNTPEVLAHLSAIQTTVISELIGSNDLPSYHLFLEKLDALLGLSLSQRKDISAEQKTLISKRQKARDNQEWQKTDELRQSLNQQHIGLRDTVNGQIWYRIPFES